jgi:transposase
VASRCCDRRCSLFVASPGRRRLTGELTLGLQVVHNDGFGLDGVSNPREHTFEMAANAAPRLVHRTAIVRLRPTRRQVRRCYGLLRSAGDVWAWVLDANRRRHQQGERPVTGYHALCRQLTGMRPFGELSVVGARSVLRRSADAWFQAAKRRSQDERAGFPRRKRALVPVRFHRGTFLVEGNRVRLPVAKGQPELWVRLARPLPYPAEQIRAVTLLADSRRLWLAVTATIPVQHIDLDSERVAGVDLGIIHPYAVVTQDAGLLISGRALRAENYLHLEDQKARQVQAGRRAPRPGQRGSRRWRRYRARVRQTEARHRRRVYQAHHEAAKQALAFVVKHRIGTLVVGDASGITDHNAGRVQNLRLRRWRRTHLLRARYDKAEQAGIVVRLVDERGTSSTCPACRRRAPKPKGREFRCPHCGFQAHRDLVGAANIAARAGGGSTSTHVPVLVEHRRAGILPARRDRRRHRHDGRRRSCLASGHSAEPPCSAECRSLDAGQYPAPDEDQATAPYRSDVA